MLGPSNNLRHSPTVAVSVEIPKVGKTHRAVGADVGVRPAISEPTLAEILEGRGLPDPLESEGLLDDRLVYGTVLIVETYMADADYFGYNRTSGK